MLRPSVFILWRWRWRTTSRCDVNFAVRDVKLDFRFDPKLVWSFRGLRYLQNTGQYSLLLGAHLVRYSVLYTTPCCGGILKKRTVPQLAKNLPEFYGTGRSIAAITTAFHLSLSWARSIQSKSQTDFLEFELNIILPSMPRSSKSFLSLGFSQQNPTCSSPSFVLHTLPVSFFFIWWVKLMKLLIIRYTLTKIILICGGSQLWSSFYSCIFR